MSEFTHSVALIAPAALREKAQRLAWAIGINEPPFDSFSAELSSDGTTITHYGQTTYDNAEFATLLLEAQQGKLPDIPWTYYGLTEQNVTDLMTQMTVVAIEGAATPVTWQQAKAMAKVDTPKRSRKH